MLFILVEVIIKMEEEYKIHPLQEEKVIPMIEDIKMILKEEINKIKN